MFGYIRPRKAELRVWEYELFRAAYCGLCRTLGERYGLLWRFLLNYDFCYLAILLCGASQKACSFCSRRCPASPVRKRRMLERTPELEYAADATVLLSYDKVRDEIRDETGLRRFGMRILERLMRRGYRRARGFRPALAEAVRRSMETLGQLEREGCPSLDRAADTFARILAAAAEDMPEEAAKRPMRELLYHTGRWIYIADAWNDAEEDSASGSYNPIVLRSPCGGTIPDAEADRLADTLELSCAAASRALALMSLGDFSGIVGNVLYLGMPSVAAEIRRGHYQPFNLRRKGSQHGSL